MGGEYPAFVSQFMDICLNLFLSRKMGA